VKAYHSERAKKFEETYSERRKRLRQIRYAKDPLLGRKYRAWRRKTEAAAGMMPSTDIIKICVEKFSGCCYCGRDDVKLQLEHIIPLSRDGSNDQHNLLGACEQCNKSKGDKEWVKWFKSQPFYDIKREEEIRRYTRGE